ncbi:adhesion G protein-coupled receptor G3 [Polypterus senegalus]|uniref:adhesion G protein-coupled receptor G3 n=1 Tax=Polypterus senegalus TaxID=55291 RepID=UPI0019638F9D|nr:adhesion G protein-coupled receptor G3 [Polypterus senegalus]
MLSLWKNLLMVIILQSIFDVIGPSNGKGNACRSTATSTTVATATSTLCSTIEAFLGHIPQNKDITKIKELLEKAKKNETQLSDLLKCSHSFYNGKIIKVNRNNTQDIHVSVSTNKHNKSVSVKIPNSAFQKVVCAADTTLDLAVMIFQNTSNFVDDKNTSILDDLVLAVDLGEPISNLPENITLSFEYSELDVKQQTLQCAFWNSTENGTSSWSTEGCITSQGTNQTDCYCNHLTFFALVMTSASLTETDLKVLSYISYIGCGISVFFLGVTLILNIMPRKKKRDHCHVINMNLCGAVFFLNLTFLMNEWVTSLQNPTACQLIAGLMHFFLLCTFTWFGIESFHLYLLVIKVFNIYVKHYLLKLHLLGWGLPALATIIFGSLNFYGQHEIQVKDSKSTFICWITNTALHYFNMGYFAVVFLFAGVIFTLVLVAILKMAPTNMGPKRKGMTWKMAITVLGLIVSLGLTWGIMFFGYGPLDKGAIYAFCILNSLQGFFLFLKYFTFHNNKSLESSESVTEGTVSASNTTSSSQ